jgi:microcin C transport system permease protein
MVINFIIVQSAPGGPVEQMINNLTQETSKNVLGNHSEIINLPNHSNIIDNQEILKEIETNYGFDKPIMERFWLMISSYARLDFGNSFFLDKKVATLIKEKLPVSLSLGILSTIIIYFLSISLGIMKAMHNGSKFDSYTNIIISLLYAVPGFILAILLLIIFASTFHIFPLRGLTSNNWDELSNIRKIFDLLHHITLPVISYSVSGVVILTMLCKNSFMEEINKQYIITAKSKGLNQKQIFYRHAFRNSILVVIATFSETLSRTLLSGSVLIETIFSLDGIGLLSFNAVMNRDYPVIFGILFISTLMALIINIINDILYTIADPRIDFKSI